MHFCVKILYLVKIHTIIDHMKRREFVYKVALGAAASALPAGKTLFADTKEKAGLPDMVAIHGGTAADMFEKGIAEMGGMSRFVKKGQTVVVLEAMKMQNNINAENDGTVTSITVNKGDSVMEGTVLLTIG